MNAQPKKKKTTSAGGPDFEQQLQQYQKKISNILESFTDAFFEVDRNWIVTYWNKEAENLMDMPRKDIIGKNLWEVYKDAVPLKFYSEHHRAVNENISIRFIEYFPPKKMWVEVASFPSGAGLSVYFKDITARQLANEQLKKEKKKYINLFNQSPVPQWVYDLETLAFLDVNQAAIRQYGYSKKEFLAMTIKDIRPKADQEILTKIIREDLIQGETNFSAVRHVKKNGEIIFVHVEGNAIQFNERNARVVMVIDQTEQIKAEIALNRSEQRFKALVQEGSDMIAILDRNANYLYVSPTTKAIVGIDAATFIGTNGFEGVHPDDKANTIAEFASVTTEKQVKLTPFRFLSADGKYLWIETILTDMTEDPAIGGIVANSRDITQRVESELKMEESINRFNIVSKATSDAIWDWDMQTGEILWNQGIRGIFGYRNTLYHIDWWEKQVHPEDLDRVLEQFQVLVRKKESRLQAEYRFRCADGEYKFVLDRFFVLFNKEGHPVRLIGSMQDITDKINYIKAIEAQNEQLRHISWMQAHAVRAPLARIMGISNLLNNDEQTSQTVKELLVHLAKSTHELDEIIKDIIRKTKT